MNKKGKVAARKPLGCLAMNKRGLIGKILFIIFGIILIIGIIIGITAYQAYSLVKTVQQETIIWQNMTQITETNDCSKIPELEASILRVKEKTESACKNPIIRIAIDKIPQMEVKCSDVPKLEQQTEEKIKPVKAFCANQTL